MGITSTTLTPLLHHLNHELGGIDEVTPLPHTSTHQTAGSDKFISDRKQTFLAIGIEHSYNTKTWNILLPGSPNFPNGRISNHTNAANGDKFAIGQYQGDGNQYKITFKSFTNLGEGIIKIRLGATLLLTADCYSPNPIYNQEFIARNITIPNNGVEYLTIEVDGKNASSSDYRISAETVTIEKE